MRTFKLFAAAITLLLLTSQIGLSQANRTLSNLTSPTAVNQHLLPNSTNAINLGSNTLRWKNLFLANREGININPQYPLDIYNKSYDRTINVYSPFTIEQIDRIGVYSKSIIAASWGYGVKALGGYYGVYAYGYVGDADDQSHGVYGEAEGTDCSVFGVAYGVHGKAHGAYDNYGVYGEASGGNACGGFNAAGYFDGAVYATSYHSISDRKFKTNITSIQDPLEQLMKLKPSVYEFKTAEYPNMVLPKGKQMGLIADEVKLVYPELVSEAVNPAHYDKDRKLISKEEKYEAINYTGLLPVMIAAIQEQQKTIEAVKAENEELKSRLTKIEQALTLSSHTSTITLSDARLEQNAPNPLTGIQL